MLPFILSASCLIIGIGLAFRRILSSERQQADYWRQKWREDCVREKLDDSQPGPSQVLALLQQEADTLRKSRRFYCHLLMAYGTLAGAFLVWQIVPLLSEMASSRTATNAAQTSGSMTGAVPASSEKSWDNHPVETAITTSPPALIVPVDTETEPMTSQLWQRLYTHIPWPTVALLALPTLWVSLRVRKALQVQHAATGALARLDEVQAVGPLAEALRIDDQHIRTVAERALTRLLPRLQASDAGLLAEHHWDSLHRLLKGQNTALILALLKALEQIGDERAVPHVQRLAEGQSAQDPQVRTAAQECLPYLQARAEQTHLRRTLLRASRASTETAEVLLRPAQESCEAQPQELLRAGGLQEE